MPSQPITKPLIIHRPMDSRLEQVCITLQKYYILLNINVWLLFKKCTIVLSPIGAHALFFLILEICLIWFETPTQKKLKFLEKKPRFFTNHCLTKSLVVNSMWKQHLFHVCALCIQLIAYMGTRTYTQVGQRYAAVQTQNKCCPHVTSLPKCWWDRFFGGHFCHYCVQTLIEQGS